VEALELQQAQMTAAFGEPQGSLDTAAQIEVAKSALARVRVTQLECVVCKALVKSKNPLKRVDMLFAEFAQETGSDASSSICPYLVEHLALMRSTRG
jgi:hypothetical protein